MNVLVFDGPGVSSSCLLHTKNALKQLLATRYDVITISAESLIKDPWTATCALLVFPGGRDLGFISSLGETGARRIKHFVEQDGGRYLGLCAGAYYACPSIEFELNRELYEVKGKRPLEFYAGVCRGTAFPGFVYDTEQGARDAVIDLEPLAWKQVWEAHPPSVAVYYNGGGYFDEPASDDSSASVLARYKELPHQPPAGLLCTPGTSGGKAVLWAVHPEHPSVSTVSAASVSSAEEPRTKLLRATLQLLNLEVPLETRTITGPTPLLLTSIEIGRAQELSNDILARFPSASSSSNSISLNDHNDTFDLYPSSSLASVFAEQRTIERTKLDLIVCSDGLPDRSLTPIFDISRFFETLSIVRKNLAFPYRPSFGDNLLYGEVVTSTQTVLQQYVYSLILSERRS